ncbi:MAG TPA: phosphatidylserine decarboxylase [Longimicrobiales bacterium]|nr:phosphatidylserine decarboxylase [Longimicrobiales bacterium]
MNGLAIAADAFLPIAVLCSLSLVLLVLASWLGRWSLWVGGWSLAAAALVVAFFFRDPERPGERGSALYLSPADGRVLAVEQVEEAVYLRGPATRVAIFLSVFDVHVQRSPVDGVVEVVEHSPGRFAAAWSERAALQNERTLIGIDTGEERVVVRQVAGLVARRIVTYVREGERVEQGQRIGLIRFGSRVDAYLPPDAIVDVLPGDRVWGGTTILGWRPGTARELDEVLR